MPNFYSIGFDLTGCTVREQSKNHRLWVSDESVAHLMRFVNEPANWPFDLRDPDAAACFYWNQCADNNGIMLSMQVITIDGVEALRGLFKYHAPGPNRLAMAYIGILWLPFETCRFQINVEAMELGTTGTREAIVMSLDRENWPQFEQLGDPLVIETEEQWNAMYEVALKKPPRHLPSDDAKYDAGFPDHPLSKVRARLDKIVESLKFDASVKGLAPFRV
jgi:hypothetical protein